MTTFTCAECDETFEDGAYTVISNEGSDVICSGCHQQMAEWTEIANAAIRKALGPEAPPEVERGVAG